ncbi:lysophospholipid acyltransferase 1 [Cryptomeria japonica]|uniref:lysophospholipid acyltransferase 1 n=1 Tax=Cryptomeria japonica TaxID=3369 RepID=UPI0025AD706D|nr:lysophospholipid acyltransferase 1 [Cryptomeria japonica]XP_057836847.1 lysophospholipid acyltransferase 1 [Cryptomeria japonica]XP_057836848.1 lysophospholipid acyltransferase 1 [Cryptomeria japonica]XP_057836849.1 lysophospholipid acyltransferase 1 [Cryptomeria japonica]XP_057836850.1 lysophospholipid acyltransferase 1 [Cryptomeria japonica]
MDMSIESMASLLGQSVPVTRFLLCFLATIPVSWGWRFMPGPLGRHLYSAFTGALLSYLSFGYSSNLHFMVPMALGYGSMLLCRHHCGRITFFSAFAYLIGCHVYYMSGDAWKEGGIDGTGALMVLTLKVISCAVNYQDGLSKGEEDGLSKENGKNRLLKCPSVLEYLGYCLCCGTHFAGPVYEIKDYLDWTENKGLWSHQNERPQPSPYGGMLRALVQASLCMGVYLYLSSHFPLSRFSEPIYVQEWGFWKRLGYQYMSGFTARWKYYFIWSLSEASVIVSGLGFTGWSDSKPKWDRAKNVDILGVEFAKSAAELPLVWNIQVSTWLRHYVYERLIQKGKKPGLVQLLATQIVSAIWHGLYAGYIIFFVHSALFIAGSKVIYRWQQSLPEKAVLGRRMLTLINIIYTAMVLNYACIGFLVLSLHETLFSYGSVHYVGTVLPIALILLGSVLKPKPRPKKKQ